MTDNEAIEILSKTAAKSYGLRYGSFDIPYVEAALQHIRNRLTLDHDLLERKKRVMAAVTAEFGPDPMIDKFMGIGISEFNKKELIQLLAYMNKRYLNHLGIGFI